MSIVFILCVVSMAVIEVFSGEVVIGTVGIVFLEIFMRVHGGFPLVEVVMLG